MALETLFVAALLLIFGIALSLQGYKWFKILLPILAFAVGFTAGSNAVSNVYGVSIFSSLVIAVAGLILGLLLAVIVYLSFNLAIILLGALFGYTIGSAIASFLGFETGLIQIVAGLILAIIAVIIVVRLNLPKYLVIALTSLIGTEAILGGLLLLTGSISVNDLKLGSWESILSQFHILAIVWLILAAGAALIQLRRAKHYELDLSSCARQVPS
ncbi:MAG: DUF4203 domain-containing protein [Methanotrichaceae archaeon]|nr:DUF4203 domain-containing protein [Methanotrichaceae archaeon]